MAFPLKQSTAGQVVPLGLFVDATDAKTPETGLTIANTDIKLWKAGATSIVNKNSGGATHMSVGEYYATFDATDSNTIGPMKVSINVAGALPREIHVIVMSAANYDAAVAGSAALAADVTHWNGTAVATPTVPGVPEVDITHFGGAAGTFASGRPETNLSHWRGTQPNGLTSGRVDVNTVVVSNNAITAASIATDAITAAKIAADAVTEIQSGLATASALTTVAGYLDTEIAAILAIANKLDTALELDGAVYRFTVNALENAPAGGGGGTSDWTAGEKEQIRHRLGIDGTATAPSAGVPSLATQASVDTIDNFVDTEVSAIKAKTDNLPASPAASGDIPAAATIAATVRTELAAELALLDAAISSRATPAQVNAQVIDVLATDTHTLPTQAAPPGSPSLEVAILYLYKFLRNKQERTSTELRVYDDAGTTIDHKAAISDDGGVFTKNEFVSGV